MPTEYTGLPTPAERAAFKRAELHRSHYCETCVGDAYQSGYNDGLMEAEERAEAATPGESRTLVEAFHKAICDRQHTILSADFEVSKRRCHIAASIARAALAEVPVIPDELDVERLARALEVVDDMDILPSLHAAEVAAEYARLSESTGSEEGR